MTEKVKKILFLFAILSLNFSSVIAQVSATAEIDSSQILIGDQVDFVIKVTSGQDDKVIWPVFTDTLTSEVIILKQSEIDSTIAENNKKIFSQVLSITSWDSGYYAIPPIRINYRNNSDNILHFSETDPILLVVMPVDVDMQADIRDIKAIKEVGITFKEILPYLLILLVIIGGVILVIYYLKKRRASDGEVAIPKIDPKIPPHVYAYEALETLEKKKMWQKGEIKSYYSELTEIIRTYIELQFNVNAMEMTSDEVLFEVPRSGIDNSSVKLLSGLLQLADMVKFAKWKPSNSEHEVSMKNATNFIKISYNHIRQISAVENNQELEINKKSEEINLIEEKDV